MNQERDIARDIPLVAASGRRRGQGCPDPAVLAAYAEAGLGTAQRAALEDHLADCSFCLGQVGFLVREADPELPAVPTGLLDAVRAPRIRSLGWPPRPAWAALAAAAGLLLAAAVVLQLARTSDLSAPDLTASDMPGYTTQTPAPQRSVRNGTTSDAGPRILEPVEGAVLAGPEIELRWQEAAQALQYAVLVVSLEGDPVWEARTTGSRLTLPAVRLLPGERYFVWVEARLAGGGTLKSPPVGFRLVLE